jgi:hypothetical protein
MGTQSSTLIQFNGPPLLISRHLRTALPLPCPPSQKTHRTAICLATSHSYTGSCTGRPGAPSPRPRITGDALLHAHADPPPFPVRDATPEFTPFTRTALRGPGRRHVQGTTFSCFFPPFFFLLFFALFTSMYDANTLSSQSPTRRGACPFLEDRPYITSNATSSSVITIRDRDAHQALPTARAS